MHQLRAPEKVGSWLYSVAHRTCLARLRKKPPHLVLDDIVEPQSDTTDLKLDVWGALQSLSQVSRQALVLYYMGGYNTREIAQFVGVSVDAVEKRLRRARESMRKEMFTLVEESMMENKLGDEFGQRVLQEVKDRLQGFNKEIILPSMEDPDKIALLDANALKWHQERQADAENNARLYGIELADVGPRMTRERIMSGTLSRAGITRQVIGVPESVVLLDFRDTSRRLLVSPFTLLKWVKQGMPTIRYEPWKWLDLDLVAKWLADNRIELPKEVTIEEMDVMERYILLEVQAGRASVEDALELLMSM